MNPDRRALADAVMALLVSIAPEVEPDTLDPTRPLRRQVDLDSMNWLDLMVGLKQRFGVEIPESDYARLVSLNDVLDHLQARLAPPGQPPTTSKGRA
ncbi:MAG: acyl carrier protein [Rubrivivax sp.]|nr:acyl carrier protein [Rubrivivax sp.]